MRHVLGVDGGGSKVVCLAADEGGRLLGYGRGGPVNTNFIPHQEAVDSLNHAINTALKGAGLRVEQIEALCMSAPMAPATVEKAMEECGIKRIIRAAEGETPAWAARYWIEGHIGVTVDGGTGSLARGWTRDGGEVGSGGWGPILGDEGSGYWIGVKAMIAVLQAEDGRIEETMLTKPVLEHFGISSIHEMIARMYGISGRVGVMVDSGHVINQGIAKGVEPHQEMAPSVGGLFFHKMPHREPLKRHELASLCPVVVKVARRGDQKALEILKEAGRELGRLGVAVIKRLDMKSDEFIVVPFGGVFKAGDLIFQAFKETIHAAAPKAKVVRPKFEPEVGAILLALNNIGLVINDQIIDAIEQSSANFPCCRGDIGD